VDKGYLLAMLATLIALFISGEAAGEVARQWAFSITLLVIFASSEIGSLFKYQKKWVLLILLTQLSTIYLTFKFQDFFT
jgi:low affinity Fe/Cu permease